MQIDTIRELFAHPPAEFGPTPFWFLNDDLDEGRIRYALEEMKSKGIAGVIIHPRTGMEVEYLSETFWERMRFICDTLRLLGLQGWIYDEYNWPSGPAGGKLLREHPEFKQFGLDYRVMSPSRLSGFLDDQPGELIAAFALSQREVSDKTGDLLSSEANVFSGGEALVFYTRAVQEPMQATCGAPWTKGESGYLDLLNPAAVDEFMKLTHFEYDQRLGEYYGEPIIGIFTDEPANYVALPFTPAMPDEFSSRYKYEFRQALPSLADQLSCVREKDRIRHRTDYFSLARDLYVDSYFKKISEWATDRGLVFTGHLNEDDRIDKLPATNISFYAPLSQMQMPGTDILCDRHGYQRNHPALVHGNFNPKALSSTAHHAGARRTLCEIWGGNGWACSPEKLKAVLNWAQACGVNFINPHAAFMSLKGLRKRDYPASHFPPQPWWRFYDKFSEYIARLSLINSDGVHVADTLFCFPTRSFWAAFDLKGKSIQLADFIEAASETLLRHQCDFDYLFDEVLDVDTAKIDDGRICLGEEAFSLLLLPLARVVPGKLLALAERFAEAGGHVIAMGYETPAHDEYGEDISEAMKTLLENGNRTNVAHRQLGTDIRGDLNWLAKTVTERLRPDLIAEGPFARDLIYLHRKTEEADFYFVANLGEQEGQAELAFRCQGRPQTWNPENGDTGNVLAYRSGLEYTHINWRFHPNQAYYIVFTDEPPVDHVESTNLVLNRVTTEFADGYTSALEVRLSHNGRRHTRNVEQALPPIHLADRWETDYPLRNIILLDSWTVEILSTPELPHWTPRDDPRLGIRARWIVELARAGFSIARAAKSVFGTDSLPTAKFAPMYEAMDTGERWSRLLGIDPAEFDEAEGVLLKLARYVGFTIGYDYPPAGCRYAMSTVFDADHIPDDLALVYEDIEGGPESVTLNGARLEGQPEPVFVWDSSNRALPIAAHVRQGRNELRMEWRQPAFPSLFPSVHGIEPVCLTGTFWVKRGRVVEQKYAAPPLPWSQIGLPNYIGSLTYKSTFELPIQYMTQQLFLKFDRIESAAEVRLNGRKAGVILWRPYTLDVTDMVVQGENTIEVTVANTAANLLAKPIPAGLIGRPYIVPYWRHRIRLTN